MQRRTGFAVAGAITMVLVAGAVAAGLNMGLLGSGTAQGSTGTLKPGDAAGLTGTEPQVVTVELTEPAAPAPASDSFQSAAPGDQPVTIVDVPAPASTQGGSSREDENEDEDEAEDEHADEDEDEHEDGSESDD